MKIIKRIFLAVIMLFTFASCISSPINLTSDVASIKPSQKKVLIACYPKNQRDWTRTLKLAFGVRNWQVNEISFWDVENINYKKRSETFLVVVDKMYLEDYEGFFGGSFFSGNVTVYDLRTGDMIIDYNLNTEEYFDVSTRIAKTLNKLVEK